MKILIEALEKINKRFEPASRTKNSSSLEFAVAQASRIQEWIKQLAYLLRAVIVDHAFDDGNKRTGAYLIFKFFEANGFPADTQKINKLVIKIAAESITNIEKLRRQIHDAEYDRTGKLQRLNYKQRIDITIDSKLLRKLKEYCTANGLKLSQFIESQMRFALGS